jgi:hypothetical protein
MDAREIDFNCRVVPKAPDSQHLRLFRTSPLDKQVKRSRLSLETMDLRALS